MQGFMVSSMDLGSYSDKVESQWHPSGYCVKVEGKNRNKKITGGNAETQSRDDGGLRPGGQHGSDPKWSVSTYILFYFDFFPTRILKVEVRVVR